MKHDPEFGIPLVILDANQNATFRQLDAYGRIVQEVAPSRKSTRTYFDDTPTGAAQSTMGGLTMTWVVTDGAPDSYEVQDFQGRVVESGIQSGAGDLAIVNSFYDVDGKVVKESLPYRIGGQVAQRWQTNTRDGLGRVTLATAANGAKTTYAYDIKATAASLSSSYFASYPKDMLKQTKKDPLGNQTSEYRGTGQGKLVAMEDALGGRVYYDYGVEGVMSRTRDAAGNELRQVIDGSGRVIETHSPDLGTTTTQFDSLNRMVAETDAKGNRNTYTYDSLDRELVSMTYDADQTLVDTTTLQYDQASHGIGKLSLRVSKGKIEHTEYYSYDSISRPDSIVEIQNEGTPGEISHQKKFTYDNVGRLETESFPSLGITIRTSYDPDTAQLNEITETQAVGRFLWSSTPSDYNSYGVLASFLLGNNVRTNLEYYNDTGWLKSIRSQNGLGAQLQDVGYTYDRAGNMKTRTDALHENAETFDYDKLNRLKESAFYDGIIQFTGSGNASSPARPQNNAGQIKSYTYDANGNFLIKSDYCASSFTYGQNAGPNAVTEACDNRYLYDANGNMTEHHKVVGGPGKTLIRDFNYTAFGRLKSATRYKADKDGFSVPVHGNRMTYGLDHSKILRSDIKDTLHVTRETRYFFGGQLRQINAPVNASPRFEVDVPTPSGESVVFEANSFPVSAYNTKYRHMDHLESPLALTDQSGNVLERQRFGPFGASQDPELGTPESPYLPSFLLEDGFTGHDSHAEVGLTDMVARAYDPALGRFIMSDAVVPDTQNSQAYSPYSYVYNAPLKLVDPSGHCPGGCFPFDYAPGGMAYSGSYVVSGYSNSAPVPGFNARKNDWLTNNANQQYMRSAVKYFNNTRDIAYNAYVMDTVLENRPGIRAMRVAEQAAEVSKNMKRFTTDGYNGTFNAADEQIRVMNMTQQERAVYDRTPRISQAIPQIAIDPKYLPARVNIMNAWNEELKDALANADGLGVLAAQNRVNRIEAKMTMLAPLAKADLMAANAYANGGVGAWAMTRFFGHKSPVNVIDLVTAGYGGNSGRGLAIVGPKMRTVQFLGSKGRVVESLHYDYGVRHESNRPTYFWGGFGKVYYSPNAGWLPSYAGAN